MFSDPRLRVVERVKCFWPDIVRAAASKGLPPALLAGLVCQESAGDPQARRFEGHYRWLFGDDIHEKIKLPSDVDLADDLVLQHYSWGLCQIMGAVAREYGFAGYMKELSEKPDLNLDIGVRHLSNKIRQARGDIRRGLLLYNGGGNRHYPDKVLAWSMYFNDCEGRESHA